MVVGTVLSKYVWNHTPPLAEAAAVAGALMTRVTGTVFSRDLVGTMAVMAALSFVRGVVYHLIVITANSFIDGVERRRFSGSHHRHGSSR